MSITASPQASATLPQFFISSFTPQFHPFRFSLVCLMLVPPTPIVLSTSAAFLSAGCWWPSWCVSSTVDGPSLSGGGPGSRKQTSRPTSKQTSVVCPHPQLPLPICWQWKKFPPRKSRASELYPPWMCSCTLSACFFFLFSAKENRRIRKAGDFLRENQGWVLLCVAAVA